MATHSSIPVWRIPWTEDPGGYSPCSCKESDMIEQLILLYMIVPFKKPKYSCSFFFKPVNLSLKDKLILFHKN